MKFVKCMDCGFSEYRVIRTDALVFCRRCVPGPISADKPPEKGFCYWKEAA